MPTPPLSDELALQAVDALKEHGRKYLAAKALGLHPDTLNNRLKAAAERGLMLDHDPAMPGYQVKSVASRVGDKWVKQAKAPGAEFEVPEGHVVKGVSALVDEEGRTIQQWVKTKEGVLDPKAIVEWLKTAFEGYKPAAKPRAAPKLVNSDLCTIIPCNDWHLGMFGWGKQTGVNWDLKIAEDVIGRGVEDTIFRSPQSEQGIVLVGGDLLHADNQENQTARSGNQLDVDGRYPKILLAAGHLVVRTVDAALMHHKTVIVRVLPGNHDEHSAVAVAYFLKAWYRKDARVAVDVDPSLFWWHRFGLCMFGATHGHTVKIAQMPAIMAHRQPEDWGATKWRYVHGFHLHHSAKVATEGNGVICEIHQAPIPQDAWHYNSGYLSGRSIQAITYHREFGEVGRVRVAMLDAS